MEIIKAFRWFRRNKKGQLVTLFHGYKGSRVIPRGEWLEAEAKMVSDGSGDKQYLSGFHVFLNEEDHQKYVKRFKYPVEVVPVEVMQIEDKWSNSTIKLARWMRVPEESV